MHSGSGYSFSPYLKIGGFLKSLGHYIQQTREIAGDLQGGGCPIFDVGKDCFDVVKRD